MKLRKMAFNYDFLGQNKLKMEFSNVYRKGSLNGGLGS